MKIEFEIDEDLVIEAAKESALDALKFSRDAYSQRSAFHKQVQAQVAEQLASSEIRDKISEVAAQRIDGIITDIVTQELRVHIKQAAREMRESGGLGNLLKTHLTAS